ncbi:MAG: acylphosphatase [Acidobacteriota bacterium]|nr:acylphosphatase [Acidobacteriota bacterium]
MAAEDRIARRYVVTGLVQGVGFRWTAQRVARSLDITGTVRNLPDGTVEIEAHGSPEALESLREALRTRMPGRVDAVHEDRLESPGRGGRPDDFRVVF